MNEEVPEQFLRVNDHDRERLGAALQMLLDRGSIAGFEPANAELYHWTFRNQELLIELGRLLGIDPRWEHESRLLLAVPEEAKFLLRLKLDASLVLMTLWYEYDTAIRDRAESPPIRIRLRQLNDSLETKFQPLRRRLIAKGRLGEILRLAERKNLIRTEPAPEFEESVLEILPTLKAAIPFQDIAEWNRHADEYLAAAVASGSSGDETEEEELDDAED